MVRPSPTKEDMAMTRRMFDFTDEQIAQIDELKERLGASSGAETVRRAVGIALSVARHDGAVIIEGADGERERLVVR